MGIVGEPFGGLGTAAGFGLGADVGSEAAVAGADVRCLRTRKDGSA